MFRFLRYNNHKQLPTFPLSKETYRNVRNTMLCKYGWMWLCVLLIWSSGAAGFQPFEISPDLQDVFVTIDSNIILTIVYIIAMALCTGYCILLYRRELYQKTHVFVLLLIPYILLMTYLGTHLHLAWMLGLAVTLLCMISCSTILSWRGNVLALDAYARWIQPYPEISTEDQLRLQEYVWQHYKNYLLHNEDLYGWIKLESDPAMQKWLHTTTVDPMWSICLRTSDFNIPKAKQLYAATTNNSTQAIDAIDLV